MTDSTVYTNSAFSEELPEANGPKHDIALYENNMATGGGNAQNVHSLYEDHGTKGSIAGTRPCETNEDSAVVFDDPRYKAFSYSPRISDSNSVQNTNAKSVVGDAYQVINVDEGQESIYQNRHGENVYNVLERDTNGEDMGLQQKYDSQNASAVLHDAGEYSPLNQGNPSKSHTIPPQEDAYYEYGSLDLGTSSVTQSPMNDDDNALGEGVEYAILEADDNRGSEHMGLHGKGLAMAVATAVLDNEEEYSELNRDTPLREKVPSKQTDVPVHRYGSSGISNDNIDDNVYNVLGEGKQPSGAERGQSPKTKPIPVRQPSEDYENVKFGLQSATIQNNATKVKSIPGLELGESSDYDALDRINSGSSVVLEDEEEYSVLNRAEPGKQRKPPTTSPKVISGEHAIPGLETGGSSDYDVLNRINNSSSIVLQDDEEYSALNRAEPDRQRKPPTTSPRVISGEHAIPGLETGGTSNYDVLNRINNSSSVVLEDEEEYSALNRGYPNEKRISSEVSLGVDSAENGYGRLEFGSSIGDQLQGVPGDHDNVYNVLGSESTPGQSGYKESFAASGGKPTAQVADGTFSGIAGHEPLYSDEIYSEMA